MAPSPVGPGVGQSPRPGGAEQLCALCLWLAFPQDGLTMCPLYSCLHGGQLKVFSGTPLAVTKMGEFERNWGWAPIIESLEITQRLRCRLAEWWDFWWHENECGSCRSPPGPQDLLETTWGMGSQVSAVIPVQLGGSWEHTVPDHIWVCFLRKLVCLSKTTPPGVN